MSDRAAGGLTHQEKINQMIRVNQAGEYGAVQIYKGQLRVLKGKEVQETIDHMLEQEEEHLARFNEQIVKRRVRPTILSPFGMWRATPWVRQRLCWAKKQLWLARSRWKR